MKNFNFEIQKFIEIFSYLQLMFDAIRTNVIFRQGAMKR